MGFTFRLTLLLMLAVMLVSLAARVVGGAQPPNPALAGFTAGCEGKPQPCWHGVVPGQTTAGEQDRLMQDRHFAPIGDGGLIASYQNTTGSPYDCQRIIIMRTQDGTGQIIVQEVILTQCYTIQSGHIMSLFRLPAVLSIKTPIFIYDQGVVSAEFTPSERWYRSPFEPVENIRLRARHNALIHGWHGFVPPWRYCQLEATMPGCL